MCAVVAHHSHRLAAAAIRALANVIKRCSATTMMGLQKELDAAAAELRKEDPTISLISGTELFLRFVTRAATADYGGFEDCKVGACKKGAFSATTNSGPYRAFRCAFATRGCTY